MAVSDFTISVGDTNITGIQAHPDHPVSSELPVLIALHGSGYTSSYFDVPGYSLLRRAAAYGFTAIAVDRPGYGGSTALPDAPDLIHKHGEKLAESLGPLLTSLGVGGRPVFLLGHSVGGAIVLTIAATSHSLDIAGVALSGVSLEAPAANVEALSQLPDQYYVQLPSEVKDMIMFGPRESLAPEMPSASHVADSTAPRSELLDINLGWLERFPAIAANVTVPVQFRLAELDALWVSHPDDVERFSRYFTATPRVDGGVIAGVGHCIDFHLAGADFQQSQLEFAASTRA